MRDNAVCTNKHTAYQPTEEEFLCPKCKAPCGDFCVDESPDYECPKLHPNDGLLCYKCDYRTTGAAYVRQIMKQRDLVPCPTCKGAGHVSSKTLVSAKKKK